MSRILDATLIATATAQQVKLQRCFQFTSPQIDGAEWNYTDAPGGLTVFGDAYTPAAITLSEKEGGDGTAATKQFTIKLPRLEPFVSLLGRGLPLVWAVTVYDVYIDEAGNPQADFIAEGQLIAAKRNAVGIELTFKPLSLWLEKSIPAMVYSPLDQRIPYGADFGVDVDSFRTAGSVDNVAQNLVFSAAASSQAQDYFAGGVLSYDRTIANQPVTLRWLILSSVPSPDPAHPERGYFVLNGPPVLLSVDDPDFYVYPGYDGSIGQSVNRFNNFAAGTGYFGFPFLPTQNPVTTSQVPGKPPATIADNPTIDHYENTTGQTITAASIGQTVAIIGTNLGKPASADALQINGVTVGALSWSSSKIVFVLPNTTSPVTVHVTTLDGLEVTDATLTIAAPQSVDHVQDATGAAITSAAITQLITIVGSGFGLSTANCYVKIGSIQVSPGSHDWKWTDTAITLDVPASNSYPYTGAISVHTDAGATIAGPDFTITGNTASNLITGYLNDAATRRLITSSVAGGILHIAGAGFGSVKPQSVTVNGLPAILKAWSDTNIKIGLPTPATFPSTGPIVVTTGGGLIITGPDFTIGAAAGSGWIDSIEDLNGNKIVAQFENIAFFIIGENLVVNGGSIANAILDFGGGVTLTLDKLSVAGRIIKVRIPAASGHGGDTGNLHWHRNNNTDTNSRSFTVSA